MYNTPSTQRVIRRARGSSRSTRSAVNSALRSIVSSRARSAAMSLGNSIPQIAPYVRAARAAYTGGKMVYGGVQLLRRRNALRRARKMSNRTSGIYHGKSGGRFAKSSKKVAKRLSKYLNKGFVDTQEVSGTVSDPDCCYLQHSAVDSDKQLRMIRKCLMRDLFKKSFGWDCQNADQVIPLEQTTGAAVEIKVQLAVQDKSTGVFTYYTVTSAPSTMDTLDKIANYSDFDLAFRNYAQGSVGATQNDTELMYFRCFMLDYGTGLSYNWRLCGQIELDAQYVNVRVQSKMKIQNRSLGAGGSSDAQAVNNNPVIGYKYDFNTGTPRTRQEGAFLLETTGGLQGVSLVRAAQLPNSFKEPPVPSVFYGLKGAAKIKIEPGEVKHGSVYYTAKVPLLKYITNLGWRYNTYSITPSYKTFHVLGKCQLYALEDLINVNVNENISLAYEVNRECAMYLTERKVVASIGQFQQYTLDNNP